MLFYKLFSCTKIDGAMNFLSRQVAGEGYIFFLDSVWVVFSLQIHDKNININQNENVNP